MALKVKSVAIPVTCLLLCVVGGGSRLSADEPLYTPPGGRNPASATSSLPHKSPVAYPVPQHLIGIDYSKQTEKQATLKSVGCVKCHTNAHDPHYSPAVKLGCVDCHGGDPSAADKRRAHVQPQLANVFISSANPVRSYTALNHERPEFIRFVNPGDLRVAHISCGTSGCHAKETLEVKKSMMTHGCMLWGAALYNNGATPSKWSKYGESYSMNGVPQRLQTVPTPSPEETARKGVLPYLDPLPRFEVAQPGNVLRIFERGGRFIPDIGIPERLEETGRPRTRLSNRGLGTGTRTDPVFLGLQKTRLLDPTLNFMGTNDHAGDFRSSGCTACHMVYANDRSPVNSGPYAKYGNQGLAAALPDEFVGHPDPTIPKHEPGHPIAHRFTSAIPTSQCIVCHIHPGTSVMNSYLGFMWWDLETDGELMYPRRERHPTSEQFTQSIMSDPNEATARGKWSDPNFLARTSELNPQLEHTQFADFHGHGWVFQAVFKKDLAGTMLDHFGNEIHHPTSEQRQLALKIPELEKELHRGRNWTESNPALLAEVRRKEMELLEKRKNVPVHMLDIHLEKGMHCVDCHFIQDVHGDTKLYGEVRAAIEIQCIDCHGTATQPAAVLANGRRQLRTSGPAARERDGKTVGRNLSIMRTPFGKRRFENIGNRIIQNSMVEKDLSWELTQVVDTIDPGHMKYNPIAALAKTVRLGADEGFAWGDFPEDGRPCAHNNNAMSCIACHSSWNPSCYGCHLPQKANEKMPSLHNEGDISRNHVAYNFQTLRDEVYMLARDGNVTGNRIGPARSSCAIHVGSYNSNREAVYLQQQTISAEGLSGIAFSTNVPHTVRGKGETKNCTDCHLAEDNDNNALLAQLLMQGTNYLNFIGRYCWVGAGEHGLLGVPVTERDEPQTVIGSSMHRVVYPQRFQKHEEHHRQLKHAHEHPGNDIGDLIFRPHRKNEVLSIQTRGEYCYAACGEGGIRIYDVAFIDHKGFSERILTAPFSPLGQKFYVKTAFATDVAAPTTIAPDPTRTHRPENFEKPIHAMYGYIYATDFHEGLISIGVGTLLDGNPLNNFIKKDVVFNPNGLLDGARSVTIFGTYAYVCCKAGLVVVSIEDPKRQFVTSIIGADQLRNPKAIEMQFRYGFLLDDDGLKVLDVTVASAPKLAAALDLEHSHNLYVARTYAYVAGGRTGLIIVDVKDPTTPRIDQIYTAHGKINDLHDVKLGITYTSEFAYLADGKNGLRVVQLTSPATPGNSGFSPRPTPELVATYKIPKGGEALCISEGVDRDRAIDESGNQIAVFGRVGAAPLSLTDQQRMYLRPNGAPWTVTDPLRDWTIKSSRSREIQLHKRTANYYGPSRHPALQNPPVKASQN
ncbi:MAG: hypothetical protein ABGZ53_11800 [Fuerstiella sp.]